MKGNYMEIRKRLAHIDWVKKKKNKTATEGWDILRGALERDIDSFVSNEKQWKRSKKRHLSKEGFRKMRFNKICGGFINIREMIKIMKFTKKH